MTPQDDFPPPPAPAAGEPAAPVAAAAPAPAPAPLPIESSLERVARELLRQQRSDRRWRIFFRLAWLGLAIAIAWALFAQRSHVATSTKPHTALVEVQGEIAPGTPPPRGPPPPRPSGGGWGGGAPPPRPPRPPPRPWYRR